MNQNDNLYRASVGDINERITGIENLRTGSLLTNHTVKMGTTVGNLFTIVGEPWGYFASISLARTDLPELPSPRIQTEYNWEHVETSFKMRTRYKFLLFDEFAENLPNVTFYFNLLYGN